jgi:uncharacterized secreted protein with C-terminal beta-propeller domain
MKKQTFKGNAAKVISEAEDYFSTLSEDELNKTYQLSIDSTRSLSQNSLVHCMLNELCLFTGEDSIHRMKKIVKKELSYYKDTEVETDDGTYITRIYDKTSEMSVRALNEFILKLEAWSLHNLNYIFECTQESKNNKKSKTW